MKLICLMILITIAIHCKTSILKSNFNVKVPKTIDLRWATWKPHYVNTGGKPSTWFPPGELVELKPQTNKRNNKTGKRKRSREEGQEKQKRSKEEEKGREEK